MVKIPVYEQQVSLDTPNIPVPKSPGANRDAFGGQVYKAQENLGAVGTDIAGVLQKHAEKKAQIKMDSAVAQADTDYRTAMQNRVFSNDAEDYEANGQKLQRPVGLLNRQLDTAVGSTQEFDKWHNDQLNNVVKNFPDEGSRNKVVQSLNSHYFSMRDNVISNEAKQERAGNVSRIESNIAQRTRDAVTVQDPMSLAAAVDGIAQTQRELNSASGYDKATGDLNINKTTGKLVETSVLSALNSDMTGAKSTLLLNSVKDKIDDADYKTISENIKKSSKKLLEDAKENAKQAKFINEAKVLFDVADGKMNNMSVSQLNDMANSGMIRNEFATAAIRAIQRPINAYEDDDMTFIDRANGIFSSKNPEQTNAALLDVLDGFSSGNLGQDKMTLLIQSAKKIGDAKAPVYRDNFKRVYDFGTEAGLRVDYKSDMTQDYLKGIAAGNDPAQAADVAISNAIQRQGIGSKKEEALNSDVISAFEYISKDGRNDKITGLKDLDSSLYQYLLKSGLTPDEASKKSYEIISSAGNVETPFEFIKGVTDGMDRSVPGWRATSSPVKDYLLKKERELNPGRAFNIIKDGVSMSIEQLHQHPFKTTFAAGARYPKAVMKFLEQVQLGDKIDVAKTGQGVFAPEDKDHRGTTEIAQDIGSRIIPEPVIKDPNDRFEYYGKVAEQFIYYLPYSTAGALTEFGLDPAYKLSFDSLGGILKIPAVAKIMGKEFQGPAWFDDMVKTAVNRFHSPFAKTADEVRVIREKQINELTDIISEKMANRMPDIKKAYEKSYGTEPTPEDIKGLIKKKLVDEGVYDKPIEEIARAVNKVKKSGIKFTDVAEAKAGGKPGDIVVDPKTGKPLQIDATEVALNTKVKMGQLATSRKAAVESGNTEAVARIDSLIEKNAKQIIEDGGGKLRMISKEGDSDYNPADPNVHFDTPGGGTRSFTVSELSADKVKGVVSEFQKEGGRTTRTTLKDINARDTAMTEIKNIGQFSGDKEINAFGEKYKDVPELRETIEKQQKLLLKRGEELRKIEDPTDEQIVEGMKIGQDAQKYREALQGLTKAQEGTKKIGGLSSESGQTIIPGVDEAAEAIKKVTNPEALESLYQKSINRFQSIENVVDKAKSLGADIKPGEDAGLSATRYLSITNQADAVLREGPYRVTPEGKVEVQGEGLQKILKDYEKLSPEKNIESRQRDLNDFLIAKRTIEDLQRPKNEFSDENIVSPEQVATQRKVLNKLTEKYGTGLNLFEDISNRLYDFQKKTLHTLVDNGLMSEAMYQNVLAKNPHYIPFDRVLPVESGGEFTPAAKNVFSGARSPVKSIKGSELEIHDVVESVIKNTYRIMDRAARNKVFKDVYNLKGIEELGISEKKPDLIPHKVEHRAAVDMDYLNQVAEFANKLGAKVKTEGTVGRRLGYYRPSTKETVRNFGTPEEVLSHEVGHFLDFKYGLKQKFYAKGDTKAVGEEIKNFMVEQGQSAARVAKVEERFAHAFEWWLSNRALAEKDIPLFSQEIEKIIAGNPDLKPLLNIRPRPGLSVEKMTDTIFVPSQFKPKGNVVEGYIDGKRKYLEVSENMFKAMTGMDEVSSGIIVKILSQPANWLRTGATITPEFIMRNPIRDQWTALIQTHVGFRPFIDTAGAMADVLGKTPAYNDWIRSGGSYASFVELARPQLKKVAAELMNNPDILKRLNVVNTLQGISQVMEQATRLGVYKAGIRSGLSPVEAAKQSREATLDFGRRGTSTKEINQVIAFFNAGVQSLDKTVRLAKEDPGGMTMKALATITIPSLLLYLKNRQDPDYKEMPRWQKDLFWMTKIGDVWVRIPKPFLFGQMFGSLPERFFEYLDTHDKSAFEKIEKSLYDSLSPVAGDPISGLIPTGIKPLVENETNWSFFRGRPIVPVSKQRLIPSEQTTDYDTETSKVLGKILNVSPSKIENLVSGYFGGSGRYVMQGGELLLNEAKKLRGEEVKPKMTSLSDVPLVKGFVARDPASGSAESIQKFYDTKEDVNKLNATYRSYLKNSDTQKADKFLKENPELKFSKEFDSVSKQMTKIDDQIDAVKESSTMQESEKRKEIDRLNRIKLDISKAANKRFEEQK